LSIHNQSRCGSLKALVSMLLAACAVTLSAGSALAQSWPGANVRIVVPYPPGTEPDALARDLGDLLARLTKRPFVIDNKPGANSIIGTDLVVKAEGDGNTLLIVDRLAVVTNPLLYSQLPYKWEQTLKPVTDLARVHLFLATRRNFPANTYREFVEYAKANQGTINVGTGGNGHVNHIGMEMLAQAEGLRFVYVPFKGVAPAMVALLGSDVDVVMAGGLAIQPLYKSQKLKVLVVGNEARATFMPEIPSIAEAGGKPGSIPSTVFSLLLPGTTPDALVSRISRTVAAVVGTPEFKKTYGDRGVEIIPSTPEMTLLSMKEDAVRYEKIIRAAGIKNE